MSRWSKLRLRSYARLWLWITQLFSSPARGVARKSHFSTMTMTTSHTSVSTTHAAIVALRGRPSSPDSHDHARPTAPDDEASTGASVGSTCSRSTVEALSTRCRLRRCGCAARGADSVATVARHARFEDFRYVGDRDAQRVHDQDGDDDSVEEPVGRRLATNRATVFGPDTLAEARNRGYRAAASAKP